MKHPIHIYGLTHPKTGVVWYVGASGHPSLRIRQHRARGTKKVRAWIRNNGTPTKTILETVTLKNWRERERHWIATCRNLNPDLLNVSKGGVGHAGGSDIEPFTLYLPLEMLAKLRGRSAETDAPVSAIIRRSIQSTIDDWDAEERREAIARGKR